MYFIRVCSNKKRQQTYIINTNGCTIFATFSTARHFYNLYYVLLPVASERGGRGVGSTRAERRATRVIKMIHSTVVCMSVSYYCSSFSLWFIFVAPPCLPAHPSPRLLALLLLVSHFVLYSTVERQRGKAENIFFNWPTSNQATTTNSNKKNSHIVYSFRILYLH